MFKKDSEKLHPLNKLVHDQHFRTVSKVAGRKHSKLLTLFLFGSAEAGAAPQVSSPG